MSDKPKVYVAGVGMITPVGFDAASTAAAVKAGVSRYADSPHYNKNFNPMKMALVPEDALPPLNEKLSSMPELTARQRRMLRLTTPALEEVLMAIPIKDPVPLFLAVPESIPGVPSAVSGNFLNCLRQQTDAKLDYALSRILATGRVGGIQAIDLAFKYFQTGQDVVLVGGVDSYLDYYLLSALDAEDRIAAEGILDGFVPGEAAGFLLLVSERVISKMPGEPLAELYLPAITNEPGHRYSDEIYKGDGLALAITAAIRNGNSFPVKNIISSMNGEHFFAKEYGVAVARNNKFLDESFNHLHPADCFGDIGAAFAPVLIGITAILQDKNVLCYCSSEKDLRAAINLSSTQ